MAWDDEIVAIVRGLIQDYPDDATGTAAVYSDDRLATIILIAGLNVQARTQWAMPFSINVSDGVLKPDPTNNATRNDSFINLASLKASCILVSAEVRQYTGQGISIRDGSSAVSLSRSPASLTLMQQTYCREYENALYYYQLGVFENGAAGEAIVGPVKSWYFGGGQGGEPQYGQGRYGADSWYGGGGGGGRGERGGGYGGNWASGGNWGNG